MESLEFNNLTIEQAREGFNLCAGNADIHYEVAELIANKGHYPMANSHLILAMEEAVKAIFLYLKYNHKDVDIDVKKMFKKHQHKHEFARDNFDVFYKKGVEVLSQMNEAQKVSFSESVLSDLGEIEADSIRFTMQAFEARYKRRASLNLKASWTNIKKWFNKADLKKSRGFYVDFQSKHWQKPEEITKDDYRFSEFVCWTFVLLSRQFRMIAQQNNPANKSE